MDQVVVRRILGTASAVLVIALGYLGMKWRYAPPPDSYTVTAVLGRAGSGLTQGSDVKARGVRIGQVASLAYDDGTATAVLRLEDDPRLPAPEDLTLVVTAKTLLGEKQIELTFPEDRFGHEPFLMAGDTLVAARPPTELQEVLDELTPFLDAIDGQDLATIVDALGEQEGEGPAIAENIELSQRLADFGQRTAQQNLENLAALADIAAALEPRAGDINRLNNAVAEATRVLREQQLDVRRNLESLTRFATGFAELLEVEEPTIDRLMRTGDRIGAVLERQAPHIANLIHGLYTYTSELGKHGGDLDDGSEYAFFRILIGGGEVDPIQVLCGHAGGSPPPGCPDDGGTP